LNALLCLKAGLRRPLPMTMTCGPPRRYPLDMLRIIMLSMAIMEPIIIPAIMAPATPIPCLGGG